MHRGLPPSEPKRLTSRSERERLATALRAFIRSCHDLLDVLEPEDARQVEPRVVARQTRLH